MIVLKGSFEATKTKFNGSVEWALLGKDAQTRYQNINYWGESDLSVEPEDENFSRNWISSGDIQHIVIVDLSIERGLTSWLSAYAGTSLFVSTFLPTKFRVNLGATVQF